MARDKQSKPLVFGDLVYAYRLSSHFRALAASTRKAYEYCFRVALHPSALGDIPVTEITPRTVQRFLDAFADKPATQASVRAGIKAVEAWAIIREDDQGRPYLQQPITFGTQVVKSDGAREPWTEEQIELAVANSPEHLARAIQLAVWTGQRMSDLIRMRWTDIDTDRDGRPRINVTQKKTDLPLYVPILPELDAIMRTWDRSLGYILTKPTGAPWEGHELSSAWNHHRTKTAALEPLRAKQQSFHGLRASAVIRLRRAGHTDLEIASMVGMSPAMVTRYSRRASQWDNVVAARKRVGSDNVVSLTDRFKNKP